MLVAARAIRSFAPRVVAPRVLLSRPCLLASRATTSLSTQAAPLSTKYEWEHDDTIASGDPSRRAHTYFILGGSRFIYASFGRLAVLKLIHSLNASADVLALASIEYDISGVEEGKNVIIKWRGKPVFIKHRTEAEIAAAESVDVSTLRDPETDSSRRQKPNWLVVLGVCTHLGCVPLGNTGDFPGGWFCPCHGSHYDQSARIRKGPAPLNLEVPPYKFIEDEKLLIG